MMRGDALRYLTWQIRDRTALRVGACLVVAFALSFPLYVAARRAPPPPPQVLAQMFHQLAFIFAMLLSAGLIAQDRAQGWYRFYLAKPVSPIWFYGQGIVLALVGMVAVSAGFMGIVSIAVGPFWRWSFLADGALTFALVGMFVIAWSTIIKRDWIAGLVTTIGVSILRAQFPRDESGFGAILHPILPPTHLLDFTRPATTGQAAWIAAWGVGLFVLSLSVLHRRPLGED
jgi:hypothetical protein